MTISVALCSYNGARFFEAQLRSIEQQSRLPDELVICDDGSLDSTREIARAFAAKAPFPVRLQFNETNLGVVKNFQQAIEMCTGDLIVLSDQDDVWRLDKLETLVQTFEVYPECGLIYSDAELVDEELKPTGKSLWEAFQVSDQFRDELLHGRGYSCLVTGSSLTGCTMAFRAKWRPLLFPVPDDVFLIHDGWIALVLASVSPAIGSAEKLVYYRQHPGQHCGTVVLNPPPKVLTREHYVVHIRHLARVHNRLKDLPLLPEAALEIAQIPAKIAHIQARLELRPAFVPRFLAALKELLSGRYHRFSNGFNSFGRDVLYPMK